MSTLSDNIRQMGGAKVGVLAAVGIIMLALFLMIGFRASVSQMTPLYSDLSLADSSQIVSELESSGIPYELSANGSVISVPSDRVLRLRMDMAQQGLPATGSIVGYEIFDKAESFGSSSFVMNVNMMRALEGELSRTISSLAGMDSARVHLVMPRREVFSRDKEKPSASVTVKLRGGKSLDSSEVSAITHLIASAVPGLEAAMVTVVDGHGRLLARGDGSDSIGASTDTMMQYRIAYEQRMESNLETLLEKVIGAGKVRVSVNANINFDRAVINTEQYDPDGQVARSVQVNSQKENAQESSSAGAVTAQNNLPGNQAAGENGDNSRRLIESTDETTNFEISKTVQNLVREGGEVERLSVAVLVDGTYQGANEDANYAPRTEEEIEKLRTLVNSAIGYNEARGDKVEIVNMRFTQEAFQLAEESFFEKFRLELQGIFQTLIIAGVAVLAILLVIRPAVQQIMKGAQVTADRANELAELETANVARIASASGGGGSGQMNDDNEGADSLIDVANIKGGMKSSSMRKVNEIVDKYPEETMGVVRGWLNTRPS